MANTYDWKINQLDAKIQEDGLNNVIYVIHWTYFATDDSVEPISVSSIGTLAVEYNPENPFIPYEDLTKNDVVGWLDNGYDVADMKINLDNQIELIKNPVDEFLAPPWDIPIPPNE
tara:strand:- start:5 stop:352 length:348 start_codon:yes stop_codon:yes gene_type:complete